jgi:hypothetical protein
MRRDRLGNARRWPMKGLGVSLCLTLALGIAGCGTNLGDSTAASIYLRITNVEARAGGFDDFSAFLHSDVLWQDPQGTDPSSVFPDTARLTILAIPKNPDFDLWGPVTVLQDVRLERYDVVYTRADGHNVAGVDVPYPINGPMAADVPFNGSAQVVFEVVRHAAKQEPPLRNLAFGGGHDILTCIAEITVHGRTGTGEVVVATARLQITFANFGND